VSTPRSRERARAETRRRRARRRTRRFAALAVLAVAAIVTLSLTAFGSGSRPTRQTVVPPPVEPVGLRPRAEAIATSSNLRIQLPVAQGSVTVIGFHGARDGSRELTPLGPQANEGLLARLWRKVTGSRKSGREWYQLGGEAGSGTNVLDVGAEAGTDVYAPVDGTVAAISDQVKSGRIVGARIDIRPIAAPSVLVSVTNLAPDPSLAVGSRVAAASSKLGVVADLARWERQALARVSHDEGNNVSIEVFSAP
jgi:hypothetical protein